VTQFGPVPTEVQHRLEGADAAELDRVADNLLVASTLDEALV
jgi:hypothetical protein